MSLIRRGPNGGEPNSAIRGIPLDDELRREIAEHEAAIRRAIDEDRATGYSRADCLRSLHGKHPGTTIDRVFSAEWPEAKPLDATVSEPEPSKAPPTSKLPPRRSAEEAAEKLDRFTWSRAFRAEKDAGRKSGLPTHTRAVLFVIADYMNPNGPNPHPGQERIAREAGMTLPSVKFHLALAVRRGWLKRTKSYRHKYGLGFEYIPAIPRGATTLPSNVDSGKRRAKEGATS